jgi:hypothetical protein
MNELSIIPDSKELVRQSTDIASLCREIVIASAVVIQDRKYVRVEGWQAIATAHGCVASARDVHKVEGGMVATGEIRRMQDGQLIATAEGFVGEDEPTWYGGEIEKDEWTGPRGQRKKTGKKITTTLPRRAEYAIRAMAQTRAISRACRGCFAHVVVLMDAGLSTTPAEEVPEGGFASDFDNHSEPKPEPAPPVEKTDAEKKSANITTLRKNIITTATKANRADDSTDIECAFCLKASALCEDPRQRDRLEGFTLDELRAIFGKWKLLLDDVMTNGTQPKAA